MPRLVDADDLLMDNSWAFYDENGNRNDACIAVENAPTIEAIPIKWIKEWANNYCDWSQEQLIGILLRTWNKKRVPTIDAEPVKHGHWIYEPKDAIEMMFTLPKCSECGAESSDGGNYCPNCGAKMDGKDD